MIMKNKVFGLTILAALISLSACKDNKSYPIYEPDPSVEFKVLTPELSFQGNDTKAQTLKIQSNTHPTIKVDADWCTVSLVPFSDKNMFEYAVLPNAAAKGRDAKITVFVNGEEKATVKVHQADTKPGFLGLGINLGNQFDANNNGVAEETAWGNPASTAATFTGIKAAGFETVRIPITWKGHIGEAPEYTIEEAYLDRIAEVVGWAKDAGLKAIVNIHHDDGIESNGTSKEGSWINIKAAAENDSVKNVITAEIAAVWKQIATKLADVSADVLMMESFNEVQDGNWGGTVTDAQLAVLNEWNQKVVDVIRETGSQNATRWIGVPCYAANLTYALSDKFVVPTDKAGKVAVAFHTYDPFDFCVECKRDELTDGDLATVEDKLFFAVDKFLAEGVQIYIGEWGCCKRENADDEYARLEYLKFFAERARAYGLSLLLWDNGANAGGTESHAYINHGTGDYVDETAKVAVETIVDAYTNAK